ncbi:MAG: hypothetical protein K9N55_02665 [Phycisphaerae bacterium]|nr:hypothetical protein [Phycisphaerae bacterium]
MIFQKFIKYPELGVSAGVYSEEKKGRWQEVMIDRRSTPKAIQIPNRQGYVESGGHIPMTPGGEGATRINLWQTGSFWDVRVRHNWPVGTGDGGGRGKFKLGITDYCIGMHPLFVIVKYLRRRFREEPILISDMLRFSGYCFAAITRCQRQTQENNKVLEL